MPNQVLFVVLNKIDLLDRLLDGFNTHGIKGATVINSTGMAHALASMEDSQVISSFRAFFSCDREENKTLFTVCDDTTAEKAKSVVREVVGNLNAPNTAIMFSVPLLFSEGITHID